jgi:hypothetical protein
MYLGQYEDARNPHHVGRGRVFFTPPLLPTGGVNMDAYGRRWGNNWPSSPDIPGDPRMAPGRFVGNARGLVVRPSLRRLRTSPWDTRGNAVIDSIAASLTLYGHGAANLSDALHGLRLQHAAHETTEQVRTGAATIEAGSMLFTRHLVDMSKPVEVTPSWSTWTEGVHWRREAFGVLLLAGMSAPESARIDIRYTPEGSSDELQVFGNLGLELGLVYVGPNVIDGRMTRLELFRARPELGDGLQPLGDGVSTLTLNFNLQPVSSAAGRPAEWLRTTRGAYTAN